MSSKKEHVNTGTNHDNFFDKHMGIAIAHLEGHTLLAASNHFHDLMALGCPIESGTSILPLLSERYRIDQGEISTCISNPLSSAIFANDAQTDTSYLIFFSAIKNINRYMAIQELNPANIFGSLNELDTLTGLSSRAVFERYDCRPIINRLDHTASVILIDLDRFKVINDTLGHPVGDKVLKLFSKRLIKIFREGDPIIRLGGDEFIVLLEGAFDDNTLIELGQRVVAAAKKTFIVQGHQIDIGASVGIAISQNNDAKWQDIYRQADLALYQAKKTGGGCVNLFTSVIELRAKARRLLEISLRRAIAKKELSLVYQPQFDTLSKDILGFEALLRWNNLEHGEVPPDVFIPIAEDIGEIHEIGDWVLKEACKQAAKWPDRIKLSVNVSVKQLLDPNFPDRIAKILTYFNIPYSRLELEITESMLIQPESQEAIERIFDMGIGIALDDFGTGYSSLSYLKNFRFSRLKIDKSFIRPGRDRSTNDIVKSILDMSNKLGLSTVAEGVETQIDFDIMKDSGCGAIQGYLLSRPISPEDVPGAIEENQHNRKI
jgi:diguanylate cyclase (GGDEF)-like protein